MGKTKIEWTDRTWNPVRGCSRVSEGCRNCYAEKMAARFSDKGQAFEGLATRSPARWTGKVRLVEEHLSDPLKWRKPQRVFVNSMSDLFHDGLSDEDIDRIFSVMALAPQHTFQVLTKRPERLREYTTGMNYRHSPDGNFSISPATVLTQTALRFNLLRDAQALIQAVHTIKWPLPNVWLGVSVEDQKTADERIPLLGRVPAAVRFVSAEPLLGPVDLLPHLYGQTSCGRPDWVITGGESGPGARPCRLDWLRNVVQDCQEAGVACFVKQLGSKFAVNYYDHEYREEYESHGWEWPEPMDWNTHHGQPPIGSRVRIQLKSRKGGDTDEWPPDLRVRQFPAPDGSTFVPEVTA